ncbi:MAG TPA: hypothetical protein VEB66_11870 [Opitutaceae bacterium]|nr:hypothetical protein [Opitutaceae bacterium]
MAPDEHLAETIIELARTCRTSDMAVIALDHLLAGFRKHVRTEPVAQLMSDALDELSKLRAAPQPEERAASLERLIQTCGQIAIMLRAEDASPRPRSDSATWFE